MRLFPMILSLKKNCAFRFSSLLLCLLGACISSPAFALTPTTTTIQASATSVTANTVITLTATVAAGYAPVQQGQVIFCEPAVATTCTGMAVRGTAQLTSAGTATLMFAPGAGSHTYTAIFQGTPYSVGIPPYAASTSGTPVTVTVSAVPTTTTISAAGGPPPSPYALTATVTGYGNSIVGASGTVSFFDTSNSNALLGTAPLGASTLTQSFVTAPGSPIATGKGPGSIAVGDFNGDGILDMAVANTTPRRAGGDNTVSIFLGDGHGGFTQGPALPIMDNGYYTPLNIVVGDFNGDGKPDLAVVSVTYLLTGTYYGGGGSGTSVQSTVGAVGIYLGDGHGGFTLTSGSPIFMGESGPNNVAVADFNGDGFLDLAVVGIGDGRTPGTVNIFLGDGSGGFTPAAVLSPPEWTPSPSSTYPLNIAAGDFNGDGIPDLAVATNSVYDYNLGAYGLTGTVDIFLGDGHGNFHQVGSGAPIATGGATPSGLVVEDFNGDGILDLATVAADTGTVSISLGDGHGGFVPAPTPSIATAANNLNNFYSAGIVVGDFNGDGIPDLAVISTGSSITGAGLIIGTNNTNQFFMFLGDGHGNFTPAPSLSAATGTAPLGLAVGDFNNDGITDLAVANTGDNTVSILLNQITQTATATLSGGVTPGSGTHQVDASYPGDSNYAPSTSATVPLLAEKLQPTLTLTASPTSVTLGQQVTLSATLATPSPVLASSTDGETIMFRNGSTNLGYGVLRGGVTTLTLPNPSVGTYSLMADYQGDNNLLYSTTAQATPFVVNPASSTTVTLASSLASSIYEAPVTFTATVPANATGTVRFLDGSTVLCNAVAISGTIATCTTSALTVGTHPITAVYSGDSSHSSATSSVLNQIVNRATPGQSGVAAVTIASSNNPSISGTSTTFTATVPANATGIVQFMDGSTALCNTAAITGTTATCTTSTLAAGTHSITAIYSGDSNFNAAISAALSQVVNPAAIVDFAITSSTGAQTIQSGASATYTIAVASVNGSFTTPVQLSATNLPSGATFAFVPTSLTPGTAGASSTFTVNVPRQSASAVQHSRALAPVAFALLLFPFACLKSFRNKTQRLLLCLLLMLISIGAMTGCVGPTPPRQQTYTITVTGTSGTLVHSTNVSLTVQ